MHRWRALLLLFLLLCPPSLLAQSTLIAGNRVIAGTLNYCEDAGSTDAYACDLDPDLPAYHAGTRYTFKANTANTGTASLNLNSLGAKTIVKTIGGLTTALADNDIQVGKIVDVIYDGTNMQMLSPPGTTTQTIASGTLALATSTIASGVCTTEQTATASGTATTDTVLVSFNQDVTSVTGYTAATTGTLRIDSYPKSGQVGVKVCNATAASITPGAVTLNFRVMRPEGQLLIAMPYAGSPRFWQDPTHRHVWNEATAQYFSCDYPLWQVYRPRCWKVDENWWDSIGDLHVILSKRGDAHGPYHDGHP